MDILWGPYTSIWLDISSLGKTVTAGSCYKLPPHVVSKLLGWFSSVCHETRRETITCLVSWFPISLPLLHNNSHNELEWSLQTKDTLTSKSIWPKQTCFSVFPQWFWPIRIQLGLLKSSWWYIGKLYQAIVSTSTNMQPRKVHYLICI